MSAKKTRRKEAHSRQRLRERKEAGEHKQLIVAKAEIPEGRVLSKGRLWRAGPDPGGSRRPWENFGPVYYEEGKAIGEVWQGI